MRPVHGPGKRETVTVGKWLIDGEMTLVHIGQQMGEVTLDREQPLMLTERINQHGFRMIERRQRRWRLIVQLGVVTHEPIDDGVHGAH